MGLGGVAELLPGTVQVCANGVMFRPNRISRATGVPIPGADLAITLTFLTHRGG